MKKGKRQLRLIPLILISFLSLVYLIYNFSPSLNFVLLGANISYVFFLFLFVFIFTYSLFAFIFASGRRGILMALFVCIYLLLRLNKLTSLYFVGLLVVLFGSLELLFLKRK